MHYGMARLLVHLLMHGEQSYAEEFRKLWLAPPSSRKGEELADLVYRVPNARLDADLKAYLQKAPPWRQHHAPPPPSQELRQRTLADAEVLVWWARLDSFQGKFGERAHQRLEQANRSRSGDNAGAPAFWLARYEQLNGSSSKAKSLYQDALNAEPDNPEYLYGLLDLYWRNSSGMSWADAAKSTEVTSTIQALRVNARTAIQLNAVAGHALFSGDVQGALDIAARARKLGPDCWQCFHNHAAALFASGESQAALEAEQGAFSRLPEYADPRVATLLQKSVAFYDAAVRAPDSVADKPRPGVLAP